MISLRGSDAVQLHVGDTFIDPGARAWDNVDKNISRRIRVTGEVDTSRPGVYKITYHIRDRAGNSAKASRFVTVVALPDTTDPVITLKGDPVVTIKEDDHYVDPGATAHDNHDGDISDKIVRQGRVNSAVPGRYTLTFDVMDRARNSAETKLRIVKVLPLGNAQSGAALAQKQCSKCHDLHGQKNRFGPPLGGVYQRTAGSVAGYGYGKTLRAANWKWDKQHLRIFLGQKSSEAIKQLSGDDSARTKMHFKGLSGRDLNDLIAFLKQN